jgi:hypothetical protein
VEEGARNRVKEIDNEIARAIGSGGKDVYRIAWVISAQVYCVANRVRKQKRREEPEQRCPDVALRAELRLPSQDAAGAV